MRRSSGQALLKVRKGGLNAAGSMRRLAQRQSHFNTGQSAGEHQIVEIAKVADPKGTVSEARKTISKRHIECFQDSGAEGIGRMSFGKHDGRQRRGMLAWSVADRLKPPRLDSGAGSRRMPGVPRQDGRQALFVKNSQRFTQAE
jgi:hypothetical protein